MFSCNLPPALLAEWPGFFTCYCGNTGGGTDTEIRVSTESRPWRRKFSRRSSRDSNPRPFNHESGALTTELSPPPHDVHYWTLCFYTHDNPATLSCLISKISALSESGKSLPTSNSLTAPLSLSFSLLFLAGFGAEGVPHKHKAGTDTSYRHHSYLVSSTEIQQNVLIGRITLSLWWMLYV